MLTNESKPFFSEQKLNLYLDGKPFGRGAEVYYVSRPIFSSDSRHLALVVRTGDKGNSVMVGGQEGKVYSSVFPSTLVFSSPNSVFYVALQEKRLYRVTQTIGEP